MDTRVFNWAQDADETSPHDEVEQSEPDVIFVNRRQRRAANAVARRHHEVHPKNTNRGPRA